MDKEKIDDFINLLKNIRHNEESYFFYVMDIEKYRNTLGKHFDTINNLIEHLKIFAEPIKQCDPAYVIKIIKAIHCISLLSTNSRCNTYLFEIINIINRELNNPEFIKLFNSNSHVYYDLIRNLDKYVIDVSEPIEKIHETIVARFNQYDIDEVVPVGPEYDYIQLLEEDDKYNKCKNMLNSHKMKRTMLPVDKLFEIMIYMEEKEKEAKRIIKKRIRIYREQQNKINGNKYNLSKILNDCSKRIINNLLG